MGKWSLFHWSQCGKIFHQGWFSCFVLPASWGLRGAHHPPVMYSPGAHESYCSAGALPKSMIYPGHLIANTGAKKLCISWEQDCKAHHCFWRQRITENLKIQDTCLNLDGTAPNCSDSPAHKVNVHLSSILLELCQDLQRKHTNVNLWGHIPLWQVMLLEYHNTSRMYSSTASHTHSKLTNSVINLYLWNPLLWIRQQDLV